jgi:putative hemolysin
MEWSSLIFIVVVLLLLGLLGGLESAYISSNKLSIELAKKQGTYAGKVWSRFSNNATRFMGTILVGYSLILVVYGLLIGDLLSPIWHWIEPRLHHSVEPYLKYVRLFVEILLSVAIVLFVEVLSRAVFKAMHLKIVSIGIIAYIANLLFDILSTFATMFVSLSEWILKYLFNKKIHARNEVFSKIDLQMYIHQLRMGEDEEVNEHNKQLFENALTIGEIKLRACLIPRKEIVSIEVNKSIDEALQLLQDTKLTRLIVYEGTIDNIIGYIHQLDMFSRPSTIRSIIHPIPVVPESMTVTDMMTKFSKERKSIAWVIDEFGGTSGIVTMEDLLEEIFGDIKDEYDLPENLVETQIKPGEYIFSGRLEIDYLFKKYQIHFPKIDAEAETLSGYLVQYHESIPKAGTRMIIGSYEVIILEVSETRIVSIKLKELN